MKGLWIASLTLLAGGWGFGPVERLITYSANGLDGREIAALTFATLFAIATLLAVSLPHLPGFDD